MADVRCACAIRAHRHPEWRCRRPVDQHEVACWLNHPWHARRLRYVNVAPGRECGPCRCEALSTMIAGAPRYADGGILLHAGLDPGGH